MPTAVYTKQFEKDLKLCQKRGKNLSKMKSVVEMLLSGSSLPLKYRDHWLSGDYAGRRECHIETDWLLVYKPHPEENAVIFERLGTHSDLF